PPKVTAAKASVVCAAKGKKGKWDNPQYALKDKGVIDSGCSWHMTGNMSYLFDFQELNGGYVAFGGNPKGGKISAATPKPTRPKTSSSGKRKNRKTCFVCRSVDHLIKDCNFHAKPKAQPTSRNYAHRGYNKQKASFTQKHPQKQIVPTAVLTKSKPVYVTAVRPVSAAIMMTRPKHAHSIDTKSKST
nr:hypothetical protein [Tanacetum cinerariifolium]